MSYFDDASLVMIPSGYKTSKVYSVKPTDGSGDLTFSRSNDTATRVNSAGLIEKVRTNVALYSEQFNNANWGPTNATVTANTTTAPDGTTTADSVAFTASSSARLEGLTAGSSPAGEITLSIYAKVASGTGSFRLRGDWSGGNSISTDFAVTTSWQRFTHTFTAASALQIMSLYNNTAGTAQTIIFWGAQAESGVATDYIATTSAAVSVGPVANVPRLDYLNSSCPRLLLEPQRQNVITFSEQMDNAAWTKAALGGSALTTVVTANQAVSPDGYTNADKVFMSLGGGTTSSDWSRLQSAAFNVTSGTAYTITFWAWASQSSEVGKKVRVGVSSNTALLDFTLTATAQRFSVTYTASSTGTDSLLFQLRGAAGLSSTAEFFLWGTQLEAGAYATSYIPTLGAAVTRGADTCSKTGISSLIGQTEGTLYAEFVHNGADILTTQTVISINSGNTQNFVNIGVYDGQLNPAVRASSVDILDLYVGPNPLPAGTHKVALAYKSGDFKIYLNGSAVYTSTAAATFGTMGQLDLGTLLSFGLQLGEGIKQALVFKTRLSNADLAALTA